MLPQHGIRRSTVFLAFALLVLIGTNLSRAQVFDLEQHRAQIAELNGLWHFHTGDDPDGNLGWANQSFDDSNWPFLRSDRTWGEQGYKDYAGIGWFRFQLELPAGDRPYALYLPEFQDSFQVFVDGRPMGTWGGLPPRQRLDNPVPVLITLPPAQPSRPIQIAIRTWAWRNGGGGPTAPPRIGELDTVREWASLQEKDRLWSWASAFLVGTGWVIAAFAALALFSLRRSEREYLWFALYGLSWAERWVGIIAEFGHFVGGWRFPLWVLSSAVLAVGEIGLLLFVWRLLRARRDRLFYCAIVCVFATLVLDLCGRLIFISGNVAAIVMGWWMFLVNLPMIPFWVCILIRLSGAARRSVADARLLLFPVGLSAVTWTFIGFLYPLQIFRVQGIEPLIRRSQELSQWPFPFGIANVADWLIQLSMIGILILRFARSRSDEQRLAGEMEAARVVQQVLIPEEIPAIPGLALEWVYKPAGQVGGDFFQILPVASPEVTRIASPEGAGAFRPLITAPNQEGFSPGSLDSAQRTSALIVIGDVSGKGMPAAMAVSLLVGTVRTLAHYTQSPAEILTAMNLRMLGRSKNGFTTCLVLRLDPDGTATVANAGHLAPYLGSHEVPVESGLPLGLAAQADYTESTFHLDPDAELTLVTDGIAEARAKTGELFGFERTASIAILSAQHIAATAQAFGQEDDITVLKIRRHPVPNLSPVGTQILAGA